MIASGRRQRGRWPTPRGVIRVALADGWAALSCLVVAPDARRRGIGRTLTAAGLRLAREQGVTRAFLQVEQHNEAARALYDGLGFVPVPGALVPSRLTLTVEALAEPADERWADPSSWYLTFGDGDIV